MTKGKFGFMKSVQDASKPENQQDVKPVNPDASKTPAVKEEKDPLEKFHTYMPRGLQRRLRHFVVDNDLSIIKAVTEAVQEYLDNRNYPE